MKKLSYEYVKNQIENSGYKLLSDRYKGNGFKLEIECVKGHQYSATYNNFREGQRCPICWGNYKLTYNLVKTQIEETGYKLISEAYKNVISKLKVECSEGHQYEVRYDSFKENHRCPVCHGNQKHSYEYIKKQIEKEQHKLLSTEYKNAHKKLNIMCLEKHKYEVTWSSFQQGSRCPICYDIAKHSRTEKDCLDITKQLTNETIIENDRTQVINPKNNKYLELDIWIPSLNKAIEFNGEYWHGSNYSKYKDNQKIKQCKEKGIDLMVINYKDWIDNKEEEIEKLIKFIGETKC